jgi:hypothetical protein
VTIGGYAGSKAYWRTAGLTERIGTGSGETVTLRFTHESESVRIGQGATQRNKAITLRRAPGLVRRGALKARGIGGSISWHLVR